MMGIYLLVGTSESSRALEREFGVESRLRNGDLAYALLGGFTTIPSLSIRPS